MPAIPTPPRPIFTRPFRPAHWVSAKTPMRDGDIVGAQRALADVGHYRPWPDLGFQPVAERRLFQGLKAFQKSKGLAPDGVMGPAGPTVQALDAARHAKATAGAKRPARSGRRGTCWAGAPTCRSICRSARAAPTGRRT